MGVSDDSSTAVKVVTHVTGIVPADRSEDFEAAYRSARGETLPPGLEKTLLIRGKGEPVVYTIVTIWSSREALEAMRSAGKPKAVALFESVGVAPKVEVGEMVESFP